MTRTLLTAAMAAAVLAGAAVAGEERYDERLARAAAEIAAARMGPLRGGLDVGEEPVLVRPLDHPPAAAAASRRSPGIWSDGLAIAVEREPAASPEL